MPGPALKEVFARFGVEFDTKAVKAGKESVESLEGKIKKLRDGVVQLEAKVSPAQLGKKLAGMRDELKKLQATKDPSDTQKARIDELKKGIAHIDSGGALGEVTAEIGKLLDEIRQLDAQRGIKVKSEELAELGQRAAVMGAGLLAAGAAVVMFAQRMAGLGLQLGDTSRELGTSATEMTAWQQVAERSGVPVEAMNGALGTLAGHLREATARTGDARFMFRRLGVEWQNADGTVRDTSAVMMDAGRSIASIGDPVRRARMGAQVLGDSWRLLAPIFEGSGASIETMRQEVRDLVGGDLEELTAQSREVRGEQARFNLALQALQTTIALRILPTFSWLMGSVSRAIAVFKRWTDESNIVRAVLYTLGAIAAVQFAQMAVALARTFGPQMLARAPMLLALAALVLTVDDLISLFEGGPSAIGDFVDAIAGAGTAAAWVGEMRDFFEHFGQYMSDAATAIRSYFTNLFAEIMDALFSGIPGYRRRVQAPTTQVIPGTTQDAHGGLHTALSPAALARMAAQQQPGGVGAAHGGAATQNVHLATNVGQIIVNGAADPEGSARAVRADLNRRSDESIRAARRHLVPRVRAAT